MGKLYSRLVKLRRYKTEKRVRQSHYEQFRSRRQGVWTDYIVKRKPSKLRVHAAGLHTSSSPHKLDPVHMQLPG